MKEKIFKAIGWGCLAVAFAAVVYRPKPPAEGIVVTIAETGPAHSVEVGPPPDISYTPAVASLPTAPPPAPAAGPTTEVAGAGFVPVGSLTTTYARASDLRSGPVKRFIQRRRGRQ